MVFALAGDSTMTRFLPGVIFLRVVFLVVALTAFVATDLVAVFFFAGALVGAFSAVLVVLVAIESS
jgi:hypothetical protein